MVLNRGKRRGDDQTSKGTDLVAHSSSVTHLTEVVCCLLLVKKLNAHDNNLISLFS